MDYKEKYEQALENLKEIKDANKDNKELVDFIENKYPELKESEDEKIRKELIEQVGYIMPKYDEVDSEGNILPTHEKRIDKYIAWLEKQGEQIDKLVKYREWLISETERWIEKENDKKNSYAGKHCCIGAANAFISARAEFEEIFDYESWSKNVCDKVEPKFKVGDWVRAISSGNIFKILSVNDGLYHVLCYDGVEANYPIEVEKDLAYWTIQDAKDGDVLDDGDLPFIFKKIDANNYSYAYCGISLNGNFRIDSDGEFGEWTWMQDIKPATKERRDLLFQKMKEAGYEWDNEKKELKKIEQTPAWSEDDENLLKLSLDNLTELKNRFGEKYGKVGDCISWLKSLRLQSHWKPSKEQMYILEWLTTNVLDDGAVGKKAKAVLSTLIEQLKSL